MKHLIIPILKLLYCLVIPIVYVFYQIIHIFWHAKPRKDLLNYLVGTDYYCTSHKSSFGSIHRIDYIKPKSLFEWYKWIFKYGPTGEVLEMSELEDIQNENTKES